MNRQPGAGRIVHSLAMLAATVAAITAVAVHPAHAAPAPIYRIDHVADGDTIDLTNGQKIRLVQIDTPEVYFTPECYGCKPPRKPSASSRPAQPSGLTVEPATDRVDQYGRLLRYVIRARDGLNVNVRLVAVGAAAPYFYLGRRGRFASLLERLALRARVQRLGLWGRCPGTLYHPTAGVNTGPA